MIFFQTHPNFDCFLSSVDVHSHFAFEKIIGPETVSIVVNPVKRYVIYIFFGCPITLFFFIFGPISMSNFEDKS